jgi:hypothetical protein
MLCNIQNNPLLNCSLTLASKNLLLCSSIICKFANTIKIKSVTNTQCSTGLSELFRVGVCFDKVGGCREGAV